MQNDAGKKTQESFIPVGFEDLAVPHYSQETARKNCFIANRILQQNSKQVDSFEVKAMPSHKRMKLICPKFFNEMG